MSYRYVQAAFDFGPRKGPTLGLMFHGSESESGLVGYLARQPARGVSANFACTFQGELVQMLPLDHASGSLNPNDRSTNKAFYGHDHLVDVLGDWWKDPNSAVISVEIEMFARTGPNAAQQAALIEWSADMVRRFPSIQGALGHADQTDTKGCPGITAGMKAVFSAIGGHGLWSDDVSGLTTTLSSPLVSGSLSIPLGVDSINVATRVHYVVPKAVTRPAISAALTGAQSESGYLVDLDGDQLHFIRASAPVVFTPMSPTSTAGTYDVIVGGKPVGSVTLP